MKVPQQEMVQLKELTGAEYNPREMSPRAMADLKRSLAEFGFIQPVVARKEDGLIVGGHQRVAAFKLLLAEQGLNAAAIEVASVPVVYVAGLSDAKTKLLNVALNKISGDWDYGKLSDLFSSLPKDLDVGTIELSGFRQTDVEDMMSLLRGSTPLTAPSDELDGQIEDGLAEQARRFVFTVDSDEDAAACRAALVSFGMTGPGDAAGAFIRLAVGAVKALEVFPEIAQVATKKEKKK